MSLGERLILIRTKAGLNQKQFAESVGLTNSSMSRAEKDQQDVGVAVRKMICHEYKVNPVWLDTGEGDMYCADISAEALIPELVELFDSNPALLRAFKTASETFTENDWRKLNDFFDTLGGSE